ncbi:hypothetical protein CLIB1423_01S01596 [[Candida] railenensis]|uniref:BioF2-like acetyltransferase domain-containing protein n=1 Tax=[Candida] railenensis TaxID=45579 RepID=A0A9P0QJ40_9ASCO|nr:hypothetical protein CLIB1423_01S01596 [[Candida] railenensis]
MSDKNTTTLNDVPVGSNSIENKILAPGSEMVLNDCVGTELQTIPSAVESISSDEVPGLKKGKKTKKNFSRAKLESTSEKRKENEENLTSNSKQVECNLEEGDISEIGQKDKKKYRTKRLLNAIRAINNEGESSSHPANTKHKEAEIPDSSTSKPYSDPKSSFTYTLWHSLKLKEICRSIWTALILDFMANLATIILFNYYSQGYDVVQSCPVVSLTLDIMIMCIWVIERQPCPDSVLGMSRVQLVTAFKIIKQLILFVVAGMIVGKIVLLIGGTIHNPLGVSKSAVKDLNLSFGSRLALILVASWSIVTNFFVLVHVWSMPEKGRGSQLFLIKTCFVNFILGVVEVKLFHSSIVSSSRSNHKVLPVLYLYTSAFLICGSTLGICVSIVVTENNRLSEIIGKVTLFLDCYFALVALLCLVCTINSLQLRGSGPGSYHVPLGIPTIFACALILSIIIIVSTRYFRLRLPPTLEVEELNLKDLTDSQKSAYAKLITFNSKANAGISGEAVLSLMESYTQTTLKGMNCKVLRVFHPQKLPKIQKAKQAISNFPWGSRTKKKGTSLQTLIDGSSSNENSKRRSLEIEDELRESHMTSKTWEAFDVQKTVFDEEETVFSIHDVEEVPKPLSKNQRKKLAKKAAAAAANGNGANFPLELTTEKDIAERAKFHADLMATEALVLLTSIEDYDLTASIAGKFGAWMNKWFGSESKSKLLCVRFGLLAFHWPFVRSTFYCSNSKYPVARSGAVMYAISSWNKSRSKQDKCTILLDPTYKNAFAEQAIRFGGWIRLRLPSSHIINLRPHKNKSLSEYFKAIKYRNQDGAFKQAGGVTIEEKDFSEENCNIAMSLWKNIAENRTSNGNTSVLIDPNIQFMQTIGTSANEKNHRTLLFLKVDDEVIASCILFRLGDTITSDLQGLHHEKARPMKAYFVMMQEVITIALREGKSFVDFGPTTERPKVDIGCQSVPITGALRTSNVLLSMAVKVAAHNVKV